MEHSWRHIPPTGNFCPVCANSHFPFCPPPPPPQYFQPPPPPPDQFFHRPLPPQPLPYDPFVDPYPQVPRRPWNGNPGYNKDSNVNSGLDYDNGQIKRMRFDPVLSDAAADDERRLRLIRDHGAVNHGLGVRNYKTWSNNTLERTNFGDQVLVDKGNYSRESNVQVKRKYGESLYNVSDNLMQNNGYGNRGHQGENYNNFEQASGNHEMQVYRNAPFQEQRSNHFSLSQHRVMEPKAAYHSSFNPNKDVGSQGLFNGQPPLPDSPPPPLPVELPGFRFPEPVASGPSSSYPIGSRPSLQSPYTLVPHANTSVSMQYSSNANPKSSGYNAEEKQAIQMTSSNTFMGKIGEFPMRHLSSDKPNVIDASLVLKPPHRSSRPDHIVIILRGLPGSGKSYLAKFLRDVEVENGGSAPRVHSMDDYFMTEVEKIEESENSKSSGSVRGKKSVAKKVMEYFYEPEMEEAYRASMLKAFKKTLDEGVFSFVIVDDRNLRVADYAQFWATAKRSGYEVYLLEATYKDPAGCAARNVHGFTLNDIQKMSDEWEEAPSLYMKLDIKSLLHGDDLEENGIEEVDMDTEDANNIGGPYGSEDTNSEKVPRPSKGDLSADGQSNDGHQWDAETQLPTEVTKELGKSKWSNDLDEDDVHKTEVIKRKSNALPGLIKSCSKKGKSVRWADQVGKIGFSIGAGKTVNISLVIGPGPGYNLKSNPLPEEEKLTQRIVKLRRQNIFQEQLRAERESFRAVFDKRKRISGLDLDEE
ncbi:hypothetical protein ACJIZ3_003386 [Penstemon smallii]|uniref:YLP motif-containing protein 1 n=1 Tax=Penstemon smallii TaxID=265156 RepID=A0ABD3UC18_9LAMI